MDNESLAIMAMSAKDAEIARLTAELKKAKQAPGAVVGYMLYADSQYGADGSFLGTSLTGSVLTDTKILEQTLAGWLNVNPNARIVAVTEMTP